MKAVPFRRVLNGDNLWCTWYVQGQRGSWKMDYQTDFPIVSVPETAHFLLCVMIVQYHQVQPTPSIFQKL
jgi:hypothetical protein